MVGSWRMSMWWLLPVLAAFALAIVATDLMRLVAHRFGIIDDPGKSPRKIHGSPMPLGGGVAVYVAFAIPTLAVLIGTSHFTSGEMGVREFVGMLLGGLVLVIGGLLDDRYDLPARTSFCFSVLGACIATACGIGVTRLTNPFGDPFVLAPFVSGAFTFLWLLGTTYTTKLLDGLDGLVASIGTVAAVLILSLSLSPQFFQPDIALLSAIVAASLVGFLLWNWHPARIFLGEGGSTVIGYLIGVLAVISGGKVATALLVLGIPALDVAFVIVRRLWKKKNPFTSSDKDHLHHLLLAKGFSQRQVVCMYAVTALAFGVTTLLFSSWQKLIVLCILGIVAVTAAVRLSRHT